MVAEVEMVALLMAVAWKMLPLITLTTAGTAALFAWDRLG